MTKRKKFDQALLSLYFGLAMLGAGVVLLIAGAALHDEFLKGLGGGLLGGGGGTTYASRQPGPKTKDNADG